MRLDYFYRAIALMLIHGIISSKLFAQDLKKINVLTMRAIDALPRGQTAYSIRTLVHEIYHRGVPRATVLKSNAGPLIATQGVSITPKDSIVFLFSRGYAKTTQPDTNDNFIQKGAAAKAAHIQFDDGIMPREYPLISFDYDDSRDGFAFGQAHEINTLKTVYYEIVKQNPKASIVLIGDCRGAKVALELATQHPPQLKAMILMAPFISGKELTNNIARGNLYFPLRRQILHNFFRIYFKRYHPKHDTLLQRLHMIGPGLPICLAHRRYDQLVSTATVLKLEEILRHNGNLVDLIITNNAQEPHSKLTGITEIQQAIATFIDQHVISGR